ncbi:MAG TPA: SigF/SigG family RNA polymerase sporulation sigma factor [Lachnospiraceae bacterium]|nr:SigF/SigG family RNA polymerase sporulation sigma factor [Lachnospiraceae bacterium]
MEETAVLIAQSQSGNKEAREVLVEKNLGLVHHIVKRFIGRGYDAEDLFQIGSIGLMKAIDKFDLTFEVKFSTYAVPMISGEIKRFLRDDGMVKVSRSLKENGWKIKQASERLGHLLGRDASLNEIAEATELRIEDIVMAMEANIEVDSIYKTIYQSDGNEITLVDKIPEKKDENETLINHMMVEQLLKILEKNERQLIELRYYKDKTQMEVAGELGISQVQVSRLEKKILLRMRQELLA